MYDHDHDLRDGLRGHVGDDHGQIRHVRVCRNSFSQEHAQVQIDLYPISIQAELSHELFPGTNVTFLPTMKAFEPGMRTTAIPPVPTEIAVAIAAIVSSIGNATVMSKKPVNLPTMIPSL